MKIGKGTKTMLHNIIQMEQELKVGSCIEIFGNLTS